MRSAHVRQRRGWCNLRIAPHGCEANPHPAPPRPPSPKPTRAPARSKARSHTHPPPERALAPSAARQVLPPPEQKNPIDPSGEPACVRLRDGSLRVDGLRLPDCFLGSGRVNSAGWGNLGRAGEAAGRGRQGGGRWRWWRISDCLVGSPGPGGLEQRRLASGVDHRRHGKMPLVS